MFGKWEVRELVYQINFPPFSARFDKRTIKEQKLIFGIFVLACVAGGIRGHDRMGSLKYRLPKNDTF